jgi:Dimerisation domain
MFTEALFQHPNIDNIDHSDVGSNEASFHIRNDEHLHGQRKPDVCLQTGSKELAMLDVYMPMMKSSAIISAGRLGLFEALAEEPLSAAALSLKIKASLTGTTVLSNFLVAIGYLERKGECLANSPSTQRGSPVPAKQITHPERFGAMSLGLCCTNSLRLCAKARQTKHYGT